MRYCKRLFDLTLAIPALVVLAPLMVFIALLVRNKLGSPVLFCQQRPGLYGKPFTLLKFRTMTDACDAQGNLLPDADRLSSFGQHLRSISLDELPELFNVLKGEMSLVGPRPLLMRYLDRYTPEQMRRHEVKPGITGWAQVCGRNALAWEQRFELDLWYIDHWSPWLDLKIIVLTVWRILKRDDISQPGEATAREFMGLAALDPRGLRVSVERRCDDERQTVETSPDKPQKRATKAKDVAAYIEELAPLATAVRGDANGFMFGDENAKVGAICVCWSPTYQVLRRAAGAGANMIICHEIPFFYETQTPWFENRRTEAKVPNLQRIRLLLSNGMCVYRAHSNWDVVPEHGNCDAFGTALGFSHEIARGRLSRIYETVPVSVKELAEHVKVCLGMDQVRVAGDLSKQVTKVGTACGGLGQLFNYPEELTALGAEVAVMGEVLDYTVRHAVELNLPLIETTHVGSESFGLRNLARLLQERFHDLQVVYVDSGVPWLWM